MNTVAPIEYGTTPNILLLGNGINIAYGGSSWDDVLASISTGEFDYDHFAIKQLPYALQTIVISSDSVSDGMNEISKGLMPKPLHNDHSELIKEYLSLPLEAVLTTNYSYEIEVAANPQFDLGIGTVSKYRLSSKSGSKSQERFGVFKYFRVGENDIWHIHGEAARPNSMIMGHYYYGELMGEIQKRIPKLIRSYKASQKNKVAFLPYSWIDLFLLSNVHIVGFGLDASEMDIWWLINCKKRHFPDTGKIYFYEPNLDKPEKYALRSLTEVFDIECFSSTVNNNGYKAFYHDVYNVIKERLT